MCQVLPGSYHGWPVAVQGVLSASTKKLKVKSYFFVDPNGVSHPSLLELAHAMLPSTEFKADNLDWSLSASPEKPMWICSSMMKSESAATGDTDISWQKFHVDLGKINWVRS